MPKTTIRDPGAHHTSSGALIRRFLPYLAKYKKVLFIDLFCAALTTMCDIILPKIMSTITNSAMGVGITLTAQIVFKLAALYFVLRVIDGAAQYFMSGIWLSESIRCGFPEIPKPGRSRRRKGRRAGRGRKALRRVRSAVPGGFARGSPLRLSDGRSSFACGRVFWSRASILDSGLPDDPARSGTGRISRAAGTSCREVGGQD